MSGPKVVRIVTREEIMSICHGHLARADAALEEWIRVGQRNGSITADDIAKAELRRESLRNLLKSDRFVDLQKQAPLETAFLFADQQERLVKAAAAAARERAVTRRRGEAAQTLLSALKRSGKSISPQLESALQSAATGCGDVESAMAAGFGLLSSEPATDANERRVLARRLKDGDDCMTLDAWLAVQPKPPADPAIARLEQWLAELVTLAGSTASAPLEDRLRTAVHEPEGPRRGLLLDGLGLDLGLALTEARQRGDLDCALRLTLAELAQSTSPSLADLATRRNAASTVAELRGILAEAQAILLREREKLGASARRAAVLKSLGALGYEVTEGLSTAWVKEGRVVLRKAAQPDYGVEINGDLEASRVQLRAVAFTDGAKGPDPIRDADAERIWCSEVTSLQAQFAEAGGGLVIERAHAIGAIPLKRIVDATCADRNQAREGRDRQTRTLS